MKQGGGGERETNFSRRILVEGLINSETAKSSETVMNQAITATRIISVKVNIELKI